MIRYSQLHLTKIDLEAKLNLKSEKCVACRRDSIPVNSATISELHPNVPSWQLTKSEGARHLVRTFKFVDFSQAMMFASLVGNIADSEGHHPRLTVEWGRVNVAWWTHKINDLHRNDFIMAAKTDEVYSRI